MTTIPFIGRKKEKALLEDALISPEAEMIAVIGRRRVGKTFLVTQTYQDRIVFELTGVQRAPLKSQLRNFKDQLSLVSGAGSEIETPTDWLDAFSMLRGWLQKLPQDKKNVLFFDELPWLSNPKSGFLEALGYFWNSWASRQNLVIVLCGSAASWMIKKVIFDTGGLHNRITQRIQLQPFTLKESEDFLHSRGILWDRYSVLQFYMVSGGIPHYLKEVKPGDSVAQTIDRVCFSSNGLLRDEFDKLYISLFKNASMHIDVIRALFQKKSGLTRYELLAHLNLTSGGQINSTLDELVQSGFIEQFYPYGKKIREKVWRLTDEYSIFYLQFIENQILQKELNWLNRIESSAYRTWSGYAFENVAIRHLDQIKAALGIQGVYTEASVFYKKGTAETRGAQIDLVLDRKDRVVNLFEIKYALSDYAFTAADLESLRSKQQTFLASTQSRKYISWVCITTFGIKNTGQIERVLTLNDLFT